MERNAFLLIACLLALLAAPAVAAPRPAARPTATPVASKVKLWPLPTLSPPWAASLRAQVWSRSPLTVIASDLYFNLRPTPSPAPAAAPAAATARPNGDAHELAVQEALRQAALAKKTSTQR